jgi:hypothetical protein
VGGQSYSVEEVVLAERADVESVVPLLLELLEPLAPAISTRLHEVGVRITVESPDPEEALIMGREQIELAFTRAELAPWTTVQLSVIDSDRLHAELWQQEDQLVGVSELAAALGVSRQRASELRTRPGFPAPVADLSSGPIWRAEQLHRFTETWQRKPGRPRKNAPVDSMGEISRLTIRRGRRQIGTFPDWISARQYVQVGDVLTIERPDGTVEMADVLEPPNPAFGSISVQLRGYLPSRREASPPFRPDPALIQHLDRGGKPREAEVRAVAARTKRSRRRVG